MNTEEFIVGCAVFAFVWFTAFVCYGIIRWSIWHFRPLVRARHDMYRRIRAEYAPEDYAKQVQWEENIVSQASNRRYQTQVKRDEKRLQAQARTKRQVQMVPVIEDSQAMPDPGLQLAKIAKLLATQRPSAPGKHPTR